MVGFWSYKMQPWTKFKLILNGMEASFINLLTFAILMTQYTTSITESWQPLILKIDPTLIHVFNVDHFSPHQRFSDVNIHRILRKGPQVRPLFGASTNSKTPISLIVWLPIALFILLIGMLRTRIQIGEYWKETLPELRSPLKRFSKISFRSKDQGLRSRTSIMSSSLTKIARKRLLPNSLRETPCEPRQSFWVVDLNSSLLKSLVDCNLNKILN